MEHIEEFQKLNIRVKNIPEEHRIDVFIGTLKDNIQHDVRLWEPDSLEKAFRLARNMDSKIMATKKRTTHNNKDGSFVAPSLPQPIRLTPQQLEEKREKGLCYSYDSKYSKGHKCAEKKLFYIDCEEEDEKDQERSKEEDILQEKSLDKEEMNLTISCNALARITTPQTIKREGQIKKKKVIVFIDSGSTHNFIHCNIAKELNCFLYPALKRQEMVANRGMINCFRKCHNIKLSMGEYVLTSPMLSIPMGGVDVVLGVQWLQSLGTIAFNFQELFMKFSMEGKEVVLRGIVGKLGKIISSNGYYQKLVKNYGRIATPLTTLLKKDAFSWTPEATKAFEHLKEEMCQAPILATPDFRKTFIVECDASRNRIGVFLMKDERPIAFESRPIKGNFLYKAIYEKQMLEILYALKKW
eukprot:PITA_28577